MGLLIGIDVGGTFTDIVLLVDGKTQTAKADTTHYDLKVGVFNAIRSASEKVGRSAEEVLADADALVYSTTVGTNALIERRGTRLGLITTHGFEDAVLVGRSTSWADGLPPSVRYDRARGRRPVPIKGSRQIRWDNGETLDTPIFSEDALRPGRRIAGPALIESPITNYAVAPGWLLDLDRWGNLRFARA